MVVPTHHDVFKAFAAPELQELDKVTAYFATPVRTADGRGGSTETYSSWTALTCDPVIQDDARALSVDVETDIHIGDIIKILNTDHS